MPHVILEHSLHCLKLDSNIDFRSIFSSLAEVFIDLAEVGNFDIFQCKFREIKADSFAIANGLGSEYCFCHVEVRIVAGRSVETRKALAEGLFKELKNALNYVVPQHIKLDLSVNIAEMTKETYIKGLLFDGK